MKYKRWAIYRANLEPVIGSEQGKARPVLIISEDAVNSLLNVVNVLPITTRKVNRKIYPNEALLYSGPSGLENESIVLCYQIRTLDKKRLSHLYGEVNSHEVQQEILGALRFQLGL